MNFESLGVGGIMGYLIIKEIAGPLIKKFNPSKNGSDGTNQIVEAIEKGNILLQKVMDENNKSHTKVETMVVEIKSGIDILRERSK